MPTWRFRCTRYPGLLVPLPGAPAVRFHHGTATVRHQEQAELLIRLGRPFGIELVSGPTDDETGTTGPAQGKPRRNASTDTWRAYAVQHYGLDPDTAAGMTREQLITHVGR